MTLNGALRFNRYIVECKFEPSGHGEIADFDLIDTEWNVNIPVARNSKVKSADLIDT